MTFDDRDHVTTHARDDAAPLPPPLPAPGARAVLDTSAPSESAARESDAAAPGRASPSLSGGEAARLEESPLGPAGGGAGIPAALVWSCGK